MPRCDLVAGHAHQRDGLTHAITLLARRRQHAGDPQARLDAVDHHKQLGVTAFDGDRLAARPAQQGPVPVLSQRVRDAGDTGGCRAQSGRQRVGRRR